MRGPGYKLDLDVRRVWRCPECGAERRLSGQYTAVRCGCRRPEPWMRIITERTVAPRPPSIVSLPEQSVESFQLTEEELAKPLEGRIRKRQNSGRLAENGPPGGNTPRPPGVSATAPPPVDASSGGPEATPFAESAPQEERESRGPRKPRAAFPSGPRPPRPERPAEQRSERSNSGQQPDSGPRENRKRPPRRRPVDEIASPAEHSVPSEVVPTEDVPPGEGYLPDVPAPREDRPPRRRRRNRKPPQGSAPAPDTGDDSFGAGLEDGPPPATE